MNANWVAVITISLPALCYGTQAVNYYMAQGRVGMAIAFSAYMVANVGLLLDFYGI